MKAEEPWLFSRSRPGHRPRKPNPWRLVFLEPAGEKEKPQRFPACEETAWAGENVVAAPTDPVRILEARGVSKSTVEMLLFNKG